MASLVASKAIESKIVALDYADLVAEKDLTGKIEEAFSHNGLGILMVVNIPDLAEKRARLLPLARAFAMLPAKAKLRYEVPSASYNCGWSHGREKLQGKPDYAKGSFYANPIYDRPVDDEALIAQYASFIAPNVWPSEELPDFEPAFKEMGRTMVEVGALVARQCDLFVKRQCPGYSNWKLFNVIRHSKCCKGRLLHYFAKESAAPLPSEASSDALRTIAAPIFTGNSASFGAPPNSSSSSPSLSSENSWATEAGSSSDEDAAKGTSSALPPAVGGEDDASDSLFSDWCGWHNDHGSLTSLVPAMYMDAEGREVPCPDPDAGLYIRSRSGSLVRARLPFLTGPDGRSGSLAFQVGETAQIHTGGLLQATPHAVRGADPKYSRAYPGGVTRETMAVFMEPNWDGDMDVPRGRTGDQAQTQAAARALPRGVPPLGKRWSEGMDFGQFTERTFGEFY